MDKGREGLTEHQGWTNEYKKQPELRGRERQTQKEREKERKRERGRGETPHLLQLLLMCCSGKPCGPCLKALSPRLAYQFKIKKSSL